MSTYPHTVLAVLVDEAGAGQPEQGDQVQASAFFNRLVEEASRRAQSERRRVIERTRPPQTGPNEAPRVRFNRD